MKKIVLSLLSLTFAGLSHLASADELLAWAQYGTGTWVAPGCSWQASGATPKGPVYSLSCAGVSGGSATRTSNSPAPETVTAGGTFYVLPKAGGTGTPINGYNYAIYKKAGSVTTSSSGSSSSTGTQPSACKAPWTKPSFDTLQQANTALGYAQYYKSCDASCRLDIVTSGPNNSKYDVVCH
ncbi:MAG: hypothetical protein EOO68_13145 [Moraxellaceae bacterium]|nr:MAG: hypothetical protein EOO68_13145 [Moraxellaceae bacterium]